MVVVGETGKYNRLKRIYNNIKTNLMKNLHINMNIFKKYRRMRKIVRIFNIDINLDRYRIGGEYIK